MDVSVSYLITFKPLVENDWTVPVIQVQLRELPTPLPVFICISVLRDDPFVLRFLEAFFLIDFVLLKGDVHKGCGDLEHLGDDRHTFGLVAVQKSGSREPFKDECKLPTQIKLDEVSEKARTLMDDLMRTESNILLFKPCPPVGGFV